LEIKQNHRNILKKKPSFNFLPNETRSSNYGHHPQYKADTEAAEIDVGAPKRQVAAGSAIRAESASANCKHLLGLCILTGQRKTEIKFCFLAKIRTSCPNAT
jgi:hypothetical protein